MSRVEIHGRDVQSVFLDALSQSIPDKVKAELKELDTIRGNLFRRLLDCRAVSMDDIKRYTELCYKHFGSIQDGAEFRKEEPTVCPECGRRIEVRRRPDDGKDR